MPSIPPVSSCQLTLVRSPQTLPLILIQCQCQTCISFRIPANIQKIPVIYEDRPSGTLYWFYKLYSESPPVFIRSSFYTVSGQEEAKGCNFLCTSQFQTFDAITFLQFFFSPRNHGGVPSKIIPLLFSTCRPRHMEKPQIYWWEKVNLVDHKSQKALQIGSRRRRWFQMYKVHHWGRSVIYGEYPILEGFRSN